MKYTKWVCDACGKESSTNIHWKKVVVTWFDMRGTQKRTFDLCKDCMILEH